MVWYLFPLFQPVDELRTVVFEMLKKKEETQGNEETIKAATSLISGSISIHLDSSHPISLPLLGYFVPAKTST